MFFYILLTAIFLLYGFINIPLVNQMASPFIALALIYFLWKDKLNRIDSKAETNELKNELADIKKLLSSQQSDNNEKTSQEGKTDKNNTEEK